METVPGAEQPEGRHRNTVRAGVQKDSLLRTLHQGHGGALVV